MNGDLEKFRERIIATLRKELEPHDLDAKYSDALMAIDLKEFGRSEREDEMAERVFVESIIKANSLFRADPMVMPLLAKLAREAAKAFYESNL